jgi:dienelactone hydrolase
VQIENITRREGPRMLAAIIVPYKLGAMTRRDLLKGTMTALAVRSLTAAPAEVLPSTQPLTWNGELDVRMMDGAHRFVERKIAESIAGRTKYWKRDFSSPAAYQKSVEPNRERFRKIIGVVDPRAAPSLERFAAGDEPEVIAETSRFRGFQVRWAVLDGVFGEGVLLEPKSALRGYVVLLTDPGEFGNQEFFRRLAENGYAVLVPALIDRTSRWSGHPDIKMTPQSHREWIYRQAFHMGRHVIGYEVQKVLAAVDWFRQKDATAKIGVAGYGEGGLLALYAAAADARLDAAMVSGYFDSRQNVWSEPIYRNVWGLLREFGDAELASLIAPRGLVVEYSKVPEAAKQNGELKTPSFESVKAEFDRIDGLVARSFQPRQLVRGGPWSSEALLAFTGQMGAPAVMPASPEKVSEHWKSFDPDGRQKRQLEELERHVQSLVRGSSRVREKFYLYKVAPELADDAWNTDSQRPPRNPAKFIEASKWYRNYFHEEVLGRFDDPPLPPNARTRRVYTQEKWVGYEVVLDVFPDLFAWGILCIPKDVRPGERRPVVVCQHGRNGVPKDAVEGDNHYYHDFAAKLAEQGFVTFAPYNLYRGEDRYRYLSRKANGVKGSLFSFIIAQHAQILRWLATLDFVDAKRIAFYGLSYGGETAVRVPTVLQDYALSICSGDFNTWTEKVAATDQGFSFMYSSEWEMPYFDMGSTFDYAEMTYLMLPRPFMVERGHDDRVGRDEWVAHEYAKVRWLYAEFGLEDKTEIEYFNGGHTIHGVGTFAFLKKHL